MDIDITIPGTTETKKLERMVVDFSRRKVTVVLTKPGVGDQVFEISRRELIEGLTDTQKNTMQSVLKQMVAKTINKSTTDLSGDVFDPDPVLVK